MKPILSKAMLIIAGQVIGLGFLFIGPFGISTHGQVVATWTDGTGNWSNSANWSTCVPGACPVVPNDSSGILYDVEIVGNTTETVFFDLGSAVVGGVFISETQALCCSGNLTMGGLENIGTFDWEGGRLMIGTIQNGGDRGHIFIDDTRLIVGSGGVVCRGLHRWTDISKR